MTVVWADELEALFAADLTAALGYRTPAGGVVVQAVAPIGLHDRERGTLGFTTSLGFSKKLERLALDPRIAMALIGEPLASEQAAPQRAPRNGTGPRVDVERAAGRLRATAHTLLGDAGSTRQHTGWLEVGDSGAVYAPHTETGYRTPASKTVQLLINGALAKQGVRASRTTDR